MSIRISRSVSVAVALLAVLSSTPASAQKVTTVEELTLRQTLSQLVGPVSTPVGDALALATQLEVSTVPFGSSSGGFVFKLDPSTGLLVRSATTFGPSFADRALTSGEGQVSVGVSFASFSYDRLNELDIDGKSFLLNTIRSGNSAVASSETANFNLTSKVLVMSGGVGVTENLDIGVAVPLVSIKMDGTTTTTLGNNVVARSAKGTGVFTGVGDIAAVAKYRFMKFGDELPDPGGIAALVTMHLPTGDKENLRGLGVNRTGVTIVGSGRMGRLQPHANFGYEWWSDGVDVPNASGGFVTVRDQMKYAAGVEIEAAPKLTVLLDLIGRQVRGGGKLEYVTRPGSGAVTSTESLVISSDGISKLTFVPGLKVNLKAKMLLSLNALIALKDNGLHARITPVAGISLTP